MVLCLNVCDKEHLALRNNFRVTKKFLITKFDCISHTFDGSTYWEKIRELKNLKLSLYKSQFKIEKSKLAKQLIDSHTTSYKTIVYKK